MMDTKVQATDVSGRPGRLARFPKTRVAHGRASDGRLTLIDSDIAKRISTMTRAMTTWMTLAMTAPRDHPAHEKDSRG